jgi:hypothetical protein
MAPQLLEANLLTPYITGSRIKLNPLATILVILLGNFIWGIPGMILFVPLFGMLKVVFDEIPQLHPYGYPGQGRGGSGSGSVRGIGAPFEANLVGGKQCFFKEEGGIKRAFLGRPAFACRRGIGAVRFGLGQVVVAGPQPSQAMACSFWWTSK